MSNDATQDPGKGSGDQAPKVIQAPTAQDAGGPASIPKPATGGTYSHGVKAGGEAGRGPQ